MAYLIIAVAWILIIAGFLGVIVPGLPGLPFILAGIFLYAFQTGFQVVDIQFLVLMGIFALAGTAADYLSGMFGAKRSGASRTGIWGAFFGGLFGLFILPFWGIFVGPLIGAILGELLSGKKSNDATRIGIGTFVGVMTGTLLKFVIATIMIFLFIKQLL
jgi:uncharacterized protein